ncbi:MAG TPA: CDP-alcohol phosphatidyltransferase family protein [Dehalococcoidia bacterium]|nr:CDP-alcohol phosphatidyltransferase family protein [Dehalococcoidia bacterium]
MIQSNPMFSLLPRSAPKRLTDPLVRVLVALHVTPNQLTTLGVLGNLGAAVLAGHGDFLAAGLVLLAASSLDFLDGALARATNRATPFGSVYDAVLDRVSETAVLVALIVLFSGRDDRPEVILAALAIVGSMLVSYVRARAEVIGVNLREGLLTRAERVVILGLALIIDQVTIALWILAIAANLTAAQRLFLVWRQSGTEAKR